jgi:hypothetical protein
MLEIVILFIFLVVVLYNLLLSVYTYKLLNIYFMLILGVSMGRIGSGSGRVILFFLT